jgi:hypothetical protein
MEDSCFDWLPSHRMNCLGITPALPFHTSNLKLLACEILFHQAHTSAKRPALPIKLAVIANEVWQSSIVLSDSLATYPTP